jgi:hypothetical protein
MARHEEALEQMRAANPIQGHDQVDADEFALSRSHFQRRFAVTTRTPSPQDVLGIKPARNWRPALVAGTAFVLVLAVLGISMFVLGGGEAPVADTAASATAVTSTPPATTLPGTATTLAPTPSTTTTPAQPSVAAGMRILSTDAEYGMDLVLDPDGLPVLLSTTRTGDEYPGTPRLYRCADVACDEFAVAELGYQADSGNLPRSSAFVVAPDGDIYLRLESYDAMFSVGRFHDGVVEPLPVLGDWASMPYVPLPAAFDDLGNPVFVVFRGDLPKTVNLLVCDDPLCESFSEIELDSATLHGHFPAVFMDDGVAHVVYATGEPTGPPDPAAGYDGAEAVFHTKVTTITDLHGSPVPSTQTIYEGLNAYLIDTVATTGGDPHIWIWQWQETEVPGRPAERFISAACQDPECVEVVVTELDDLDRLLIGDFDPQMKPIAVYLETVYDPDEYAGYLAEEQRIAEEGLDLGADEPEARGTNVVVARCVDPVCTGVERTTIAAGETSRWNDSFELEVAPNGTIFVAVAGGEGSPSVGLRLFVFPDGELGPGVDPIEGYGVH